MSATDVLLVDDSAMDRLLASAMLEKAGFVVRQVANGQEALAAIETHQPAVVVTDLQMPKMDGFQLVEMVRTRFPSLPVILMTAHGSEKVAAAALRRGAASYVSKRNLARDMASTVTDVLAIAQVGKREEQLIAGALEEVTLMFAIGNDLNAVPPIIRHIEFYFYSFGLCDYAERLQAGVALREALNNAVYHGNLEIDSDATEANGGDFFALVKKRTEMAPYADRRVHLSVQLTQRAATIVVRDEGPGFEVQDIQDPTEEENLYRDHGRGLMLMRTFMDKVTHNETGNEVTMLKLASRKTD